MARPSEALAEDRINVIAVYKSVEVDRTVWDRRRRNVKEAHLNGAACDLPGGYELCEVEVPPGLKAHVFVDDISDMYPTVVASRERAITNAMAIDLPARDCVHMLAYKRFAKEAKRLEGARHHREALGLDACSVSKDLTKTIGPPTKLVACASSLVMGDLNAVDYATGAHENVLLSGGAMPPDKRLRHGQPIPRGDLLHALVIDDRVGIIAGTGLIDSRVKNMFAEFDLGTDACAKAGLP